MQKKEMASQSTKLHQQEKELASNKQSFKRLKDDYAELNRELENSQLHLSRNTENLLRLKSEILNKETSISDLTRQIKARRASLDELYIRQAEQENVIASKEVEIEKQSLVIRTQYSVLIFAVVGILSVLALVGVIYKNGRAKQRANQKLQEHVEALDKANHQLKKTQKQLVESEKMASLGALVAGVAHEINTPLGVSVTAASLLSDRIKDFNKEYQSGELKRSSLDDLLLDTKESSDILLRNLHRAGELIRNFKQVAVDQSSENKRPFELKSYLEELIQSLRPQLKKGGHRIFIKAAGSINMNSYPGVLAQVMTNLIMNSVIHGFKDKTGGEVDIDVRLNDEQVLIDYQDDGWGLDDTQREKVFEPFYTTTRASGGSGLGMSISYNLVVSKLSGSITCLESSQGAHFKIVFPASL